LRDGGRGGCGGDCRGGGDDSRGARRGCGVWRSRCASRSLSRSRCWSRSQSE
jgi:hypothetical protein